MKYDYQKLNAFRKPITCLKNCNSSMKRLGMCDCVKAKIQTVNSNPLFDFQYWMIVAFSFVILSFFTNINFISSITILLAVWIYFKYFKKR